MACRTETVEELSDLDIPQMLELNLEFEGISQSFMDLESGYYYFVSTGCSACLDEDLAKVEDFNLSNPNKISVILKSKETIARVSLFLNNTKIYKAQTELSHSSFMLMKLDNEIYLVELNKVTDKLNKEF
jgi:hypothetical protein